MIRNDNTNKLKNRGIFRNGLLSTMVLTTISVGLREDIEAKLTPAVLASVPMVVMGNPPAALVAPVGAPLLACNIALANTLANAMAAPLANIAGIGVNVAQAFLANAPAFAAAPVAPVAAGPGIPGVPPPALGAVIPVNVGMAFFGPPPPVLPLPAAITDPAIAVATLIIACARTVHGKQVVQRQLQRQLQRQVVQRQVVQPPY
jgi:hypothetical protein